MQPWALFVTRIEKASNALDFVPQLHGPVPQAGGAEKGPGEIGFLDVSKEVAELEVAEFMNVVLPMVTNLSRFTLGQPRVNFATL